MGHVAERNGDQRPGPDEQQPGTAIEPARPGQPAHPAQPVQPPNQEQPPQEPAELDAEQLRQFQQFQQFQDFLRYSEAQQQGGGELTPRPTQQPAPPHPQAGPPAPPGSPPQLAPVAPQEPPRRPKLPRWLRRLGVKVLGWVIVLIILALAVNWAYDHLFGTGDEDLPASMTGGGTYKTNDLLSDLPYEAVRQVYDAIAQEDPRTGEPPVPAACGRFAEAVRQTFAANLGYADCRQAVLALHTEVTDINDYAESIPSTVSEPVTGETVRIDSCDFEVAGGPALGVFTVSQVELGQWLITGHEQGPRKCPAPTSTSR
ncbi:hypothetical protein [Amycolatopsis palatopharyngis]|uniref:hypothetical protein n=1 Tax=Amycolatopsis palatopharyngis TaxID=187982 RepID=UPI000E288DC8|nr:hypothetical protein [Amycolatopsis palatopharyngis]